MPPATFPPAETALLLVDALNEFLAPEGKLYKMTRATAEATNAIATRRQHEAETERHRKTLPRIPHVVRVSRRAITGDVVPWTCTAFGSAGRDEHGDTAGKDGRCSGIRVRPLPVSREHLHAL